MVVLLLFISVVLSVWFVWCE